MIQVFDWETGKYKGKLVGAGADATGDLAGQSVFSGSVEGLTIAGNHLFAVDEGAGRIQIFDLSNPKSFNTDLAGFAPTRRARNGGYKGFFGHAPLVDFEDKNNKTLQQQVKDGSIIPGQANPPGYFCSPDSIASYMDREAARRTSPSPINAITVLPSIAGLTSTGQWRGGAEKQPSRERRGWRSCGQRRKGRAQEGQKEALILSPKAISI